MFSRSITTLNIEASSVRVLSIQGRKIKRWGSVSLPSGLIKDTLVLNPAGVASAIADLFRSVRVSKSGVVVSLTGFRSISRFVTLPKLRADQMEEAIRWTARREMPVPSEELRLSWRIVGTQDTEQRVFLLGTPKNLLDTLSQTLQKAGIRPRAVDLKPLALARVVGRAEAIILDLEAGSMSTVILVKGIPEVMHTATIQQEGLLLDDMVQKLIDDLSRTVGFYNNAHPEHTISPTTPIFLTGEMASAPLVGLVQKSIGYPVGSIEAGVKLPPDLSLSQYAVNIGLALREMLPRKRDKTALAQSRPISMNILPTK
ncbi:MAG: pilus assembly protein PilM [Chloroflexota bacterium]